MDISFTLSTHWAIQWWQGPQGPPTNETMGKPRFTWPQVTSRNCYQATKPSQWWGGKGVGIWSTISKPNVPWNVCEKETSKESKGIYFGVFWGTSRSSLDSGYINIQFGLPPRKQETTLWISHVIYIYLPRWDFFQQFINCSMEIFSYKRKQWKTYPQLSA